MADLSFTVSTVGLTVPFVVTENDAPISNALSATVVWHAADGRERPLTLLTPVCAVFIYTLSANDYRTPRFETGQLFVSFGTAGFWTSSFTVQVHPHI